MLSLWDKEVIKQPVKGRGILSPLLTSPTSSWQHPTIPSEGQQNNSDYFHNINWLGASGGCFSTSLLSVNHFCPPKPSVDEVKTPSLFPPFPATLTKSTEYSLGLVLNLLFWAVSNNRTHRLHTVYRNNELLYNRYLK